MRLIHIHPILIIFIVISVITGTFIHLFILLSIVFIHEVGHFLAAKWYRWRINAIILWVFGGVMKTEESANRPIKEDMIVTAAGPFQHVMIYFCISGLTLLPLIPDSIIETAFYYNTVILLFNLLPIYPLDGGKLLFYLLSFFIPYKKAHRFTILFSILVCSFLILFQLFILPFTLSSLLIIVFLLIENRTEWKNHYFLFMRFLLNRLHEESEHKVKRLDVPPDLRLIDIFAFFERNKKHHIYVNGQEKEPLSEKKSLHFYFKEKRYNETIAEIMKYP
ncbi:stage IV sporulation protein FB [Pseudogracilibacillus auburnensis]|nr:stage IV sporulation protein FB [Pseudogracilibacillus auburnensis]